MSLGVPHTGGPARRRGRLAQAAVAAGTLAMAALPAAVSPLAVAAQGASNCTPIASGLASPRFVTVGDDGAIYVTEAGTGGAEQVPPTQPGGPPGTRGLTGQVTKIGADGSKTVVASALPSYFSPAEGAVGASGIVVAGGAAWVATGGAGPNYTTVPAPLRNEAAVIRIPLNGGTTVRTADIGAYERDNNPGGFAVDTDPYGLAIGQGGVLYAADAGGNVVYRISPDTGRMEVLAVIPGIAVPAGAGLPPGGNPARGGANEIDPVPTGLAVGPDGSVYAALLTGFPFPRGGAKVVKIAPNGTVSDYARGLTMPVGLTMGPDNNLYVSEISTNLNITATPPQIAPGRVQRILPDGRTQVVADNIPAPNGIAFDRNGTLLVTANTAFTPPQAGNAGQLLRCTVVAGASATGAPAGAILPRTGSGPARSGLPFASLAAGALAAAAGVAGGAFAYLRRRVRVS